MAAADGPSDRGSFARSLALSLILHGGALVLLVLARPPSRPILPPEPSIAVEFVPARPRGDAPPPTSDPSAPPSGSGPAVVPEIASRPAPVVPGGTKVPERLAPAPPDAAPPAAAPPGRHYVQSKQMLSTAALAAPQSRGARDNIMRMPDDARIEQLCNLEAMSQIAAWSPRFQPDQVVSDATAEPTLSGERYAAEGAAFRTRDKDGRDRWIAVAFHCTLSRDLKTVTGFEFSLGQAIPKSRWQSLNLPLGDGEPEE